MGTLYRAGQIIDLGDDAFAGMVNAALRGPGIYERGLAQLELGPVVVDTPAPVVAVTPKPEAPPAPVTSRKRGRK